MSYDDTDHFPQQHRWLTGKFQSQTKGKLKWMKRRDELFEKRSSFIPIEFCHDKELVLHMFKTIEIDAHVFDCIQADVIDNDLLVRIMNRLNDSSVRSEAIDNFIELFKRYNITLDGNSKEGKEFVSAYEMENGKYETALKLFIASGNVSNILRQDVDFIYDVFKHFNGDERMLHIVLYFCMADKDALLRFAEINPHVVACASQEFQQDENFLRELIDTNTDYLKHLIFATEHDKNSAKAKKCREILSNDSLRRKMENDEKFILHYCAVDPELFRLISPKLLVDKKFLFNILEKIEKCPFALSTVLNHIPEVMKSDFDIMLKAVKIDPISFMHASDQLMHDQEFVLKCLGRYSDLIFPMIPNEFLQDREFLMEMLEINGSLLEYAPSEFQDDEEMVLQALKSDGGSIDFVSTRLKNDRDFLLKAKKQTNLYVNLLSRAIVNDEFLLESLESPFVDDVYEEIEARGLRDNYDFMKEAIKRVYSYTELPDNFKALKEMSLLAISVDGRELKYVHHKDDLEVQKAAVNQNGYFIKQSQELLDYRLECAYFGCKI
ncbi:predicted protein [Naegleria gruberi]|uniref:Predicted protein n=1 Tax=Naegleria gruberi TaxID=5762 RepID=D2VPC0_NAEGR|nr:uncharacterized protein NAEGRDRAFT_70801 [Naegleria gruberi]EFC41328.1 predicted protein [Naegleria gruberi]|eukprot:XP_002674072.1 predicted protein [Naegleria gruberi strain NEG-M]